MPLVLVRREEEGESEGDCRRLFVCVVCECSKLLRARAHIQHASGRRRIDACLLMTMRMMMIIRKGKGERP